MGIFDFFRSKKKPAPAPVAKIIAAPVQSGNSLDCRNLNCPMPIVKISEAFKALQAGDTLTVTATDPAFRADLEAWTRKTGNQLVSFSDDAVKSAVVRKV